MKSKGGWRLIVGALVIVLVFAFLLTGGFMLFIREQGSLAQSLAGHEEIWMPQEESSAETSLAAGNADEDGYIKTANSSAVVTPEQYPDNVEGVFVLYYEDDKTKVFLNDRNNNAVKNFEESGIAYSSFYEISAQMKRLNQLYAVELTGQMDMYFDSSETMEGSYSRWTVIAKNNGGTNIIVEFYAETAEVVSIAYFEGEKYWYTSNYERFITFKDAIQPRFFEVAGNAYWSYFTLDEVLENYENYGGVDGEVEGASNEEYFG